MRKPVLVNSVLVDTNIALDLVLARQPWAPEAAMLLNHASTGGIRGYIAAHAITTIHYIVAKNTSSATASVAISDLLDILTVVPMDGEDFHRALSLELRDFEDAVQVAACLKVGASVLVTRDPRDFKGAPVTTMSPGQVLALLRLK